MVTAKDTQSHLITLYRQGLNGDKEAYEQFLEHITPLLRKIVTRQLGISECEDVVQEILISIHKARHTYDGSRPLMPWLMAIARFRISDYLRKHYAHRRHLTVDIADYENQLADVTKTMDASESINELLHGVSEKDKRILTLMHVEGYSAKEVGKQMQMNESAVKVAAHRAIKKMRERFSA